jgi:hypothetical protein
LICEGNPSDTPSAAKIIRIKADKKSTKQCKPCVSFDFEVSRTLQFLASIHGKKTLRQPAPVPGAWGGKAVSELSLKCRGSLTAARRRHLVSRSRFAETESVLPLVSPLI